MNESELLWAVRAEIPKKSSSELRIIHAKLMTAVARSQIQKEYLRLAMYEFVKTMVEDELTTRTIMGECR